MRRSNTLALTLVIIAFAGCDSHPIGKRFVTKDTNRMGIPASNYTSAISPHFYAVANGTEVAVVGPDDGYCRSAPDPDSRLCRVLTGEYKGYFGSFDVDDLAPAR